MNANEGEGLLERHVAHRSWPHVVTNNNNNIIIFSLMKSLQNARYTCAHLSRRKESNTGVCQTHDDGIYYNNTRPRLPRRTLRKVLTKANSVHAYKARQRSVVWHTELHRRDLNNLPRCWRSLTVSRWTHTASMQRLWSLSRQPASVCLQAASAVYRHLHRLIEVRFTKLVLIIKADRPLTRERPLIIDKQTIPMDW